MTKIGFIATSLMVATAGMFVSCSADDDTLTSEQSAYSYSASEVQEILELQEEYGVKFSFQQSGNVPLPSIKKMEELCKIITTMQSSTNHGIKGKNSVHFSNARKRSSKIEYGGENYSGSWKDSDSANKYGTFEYEIFWEDIIPTFEDEGEVGFTILSEPNVKDTYFDYSFSYDIEGSGTIVYTIHVTVTFGNSLTTSSFDIKGECEA